MSDDARMNTRSSEELVKDRREILIAPGVIGAIIGAISAVVGYLNDMDKKEAAKEANAKLDLLIALAVEILLEIRRLRIVMREELERAFREDDIRVLNALRKDVGDLIAAIKSHKKIPPDIRQALQDKFEQIKTLTYKMQGYGYAAYGAVIAGSLLTLQLGVLLGMDRDFLRSVYSNLRDYFAKALVDRGGTASETPVEVLRTSTALEVLQWGYINSFPTKGWLGEDEFDLHSPGEDGYTEHWWIDWYLTLKGTKPATIEDRMGFRFRGLDPDVHSSTSSPGSRFPSYPAMIPGMNSHIEHHDGALDGRSTVLRWINGKCAERDDNWSTIVGLRELKTNVEKVIVELDKLAHDHIH
ncbi:hypothetical protein GOE06_23310 [Sinorhizobium medicae]|nr:hypothetical protein [Sinorhizobium medicae]